MRRWLFAVPLLLGCTDLPDIESDTCGNGIAERGEDCDTKDPSCVQKGKPGQCRFDCSLVDGARRTCPTGYQCGLSDGICRQPAGDFVALDTVGAAQSGYVAAGDFDGDGRDDILSAELDRFSVHFTGATGKVENTVEIPAFTTEPAMGRFTDAATMSFAVALGDVSVFRGTSDRSLSPKAFAPFQIEPDTVDTVMLDALQFQPILDKGDPRSLGDEVVGLVANTNKTASLLDVRSNTPIFTIPLDLTADLAQPPTDHHAPFPHADLDSNFTLPFAGNGEEFVVALQKQTAVTVYSLGRWDDVDKTYVWNSQDGGKTPAKVTTVSLPVGRTLPVYDPKLRQGPDSTELQPPPLVVLADVNGDQCIDIVAMAEGPQHSQLMVAYSDGKGAFFPDEAFTGTPNTFGLFVLTYEDKLANGDADAFAEGIPLAVGDINGDNIVDFVATDGINLSYGEIPNQKWYGAATRKNWISAAIANANGDLWPDVYALAPGSRQIDLLVGTYFGIFNEVQLSTSGYVRQMAVGDFDGNLIQDVAFFDRSTVTKTDTFNVMFGRANAPPTTPQSFASYPKIVGIDAGSVVNQTATFDAVGDIGVIAKNSENHLTAALFSGRTDGQLRSPFGLYFKDEQNIDRIAVAQRAVVGNFDGQGNADLAFLTGPSDGSSSGPDSPVDGEFRGWIAPTTGDADLDPTTTKPSGPIDRKFAICNALFAAVDLDGPSEDGVDELVSFAPVFESDSSKEITGGGVAISRVENGVLVLDPASIVSPLPEIYSTPYTSTTCSRNFSSGPKDSSPGEEKPVFPGQVAVADVNGDGLRDIVALAYTPVAFSLETSIVVFLNQGNGKLDVENRKIFKLAQDDPTVVQVIINFALVNTDADPLPEIAYAVMAGKSANNIQPKGVFLAKLDLDGQVFQAPRPLPDVAVDFRMTSGDLDGDGVPDLIVAGESGVQTYRGIPVSP